MGRSLRLFTSVCAAALAALLLAAVVDTSAQDPQYVVLASTTSTDGSGLLEAILPSFTRKTGIQVRVVAVGTGQAIRLAEKGDADVLLVHHPESERAFVAGGHGVERHPVMHNDFVIVGPRSDPAGARGQRATEALRKIATSRALFVSRGDDSGTHKKELSLWSEAGLDPRPHSGAWYRETGSSQGATLNAALGLGAYSLSDRGTWLRFASKGDLEVLVEGDPLLFNPYGVILVNPERHAHVRAKEGQVLIAWLLSDEGQAEIAAFRIDGRQAFFPNASTGGD